MIRNLLFQNTIWLFLGSLYFFTLSAQAQELSRKQQALEAGPQQKPEDFSTHKGKQVFWLPARQNPINAKYQPIEDNKEFYDRVHKILESVMQAGSVDAVKVDAKGDIIYNGVVISAIFYSDTMRTPFSENDQYVLRAKLSRQVRTILSLQSTQDSLPAAGGGQVLPATTYSGTDPKSRATIFSDQGMPKSEDPIQPKPVEAVPPAPKIEDLARPILREIEKKPTTPAVTLEQPSRWMEAKDFTEEKLPHFKNAVSILELTDRSLADRIKSEIGKTRVYLAAVERQYLTGITLPNPDTITDLIDNKDRVIRILHTSFWEMTEVHKAYTFLYAIIQGILPTSWAKQTKEAKALKFAMSVYKHEQVQKISAFEQTRFTALKRELAISPKTQELESVSESIAILRDALKEKVGQYRVILIENGADPELLYEDMDWLVLAVTNQARKLFTEDCKALYGSAPEISPIETQLHVSFLIEIRGLIRKMKSQGSSEGMANKLRVLRAAAEVLLETEINEADVKEVLDLLEKIRSKPRIPLPVPQK